MRCGKAEAPRRADARQGRQRSPRRILTAGVPCRVLREITEEDKYPYPMYQPPEKVHKKSC